jgi:hypothetical protein
MAKRESIASLTPGTGMFPEAALRVPNANLNTLSAVFGVAGVWVGGPSVPGGEVGTLCATGLVGIVIRSSFCESGLALSPVELSLQAFAPSARLGLEVRVLGASLAFAFWLASCV